MKNKGTTWNNLRSDQTLPRISMYKFGYSKYFPQKKAETQKITNMATVMPSAMPSATNGGEYPHWFPPFFWDVPLPWLISGG